MSNSRNDLFNDKRLDHFIQRHGKVFAGTHLIIEVIDGKGLDDESRIAQAFRDCVTTCGATLLHLYTHKFTPQGVSGVAVLGESHISVHTWPEIGYGAFDVFMCGNAEVWRAVEVLHRTFSASEVRVREFLRGDQIVERYVLTDEGKDMRNVELTDANMREADLGGAQG